MTHCAMIYMRILLVFMVIRSSPLRATTWPAVQPFHQRRIISLQDPTRDVPWRFTIRTQGDVVYRAECHTGEYEGSFLGIFNFSGIYQCAMFAMKGQRAVSWNLFADNTADEHASDWNNRGRMLADNLRASCARYPEYGAVRHFRMRGMVLTMRFENLAWDWCRR